MDNENKSRTEWLELYGELARLREKDPESLTRSQADFLGQVDGISLLFDPAEMLADELEAAFETVGEAIERTENPSERCANVIEADFGRPAIPVAYRIAAQSAKNEGDFYRLLEKAMEQGVRELRIREIVNLEEGVEGGDSVLATIEGGHVVIRAPRSFPVSVDLAGFEETLEPGEEISLLVGLLQNVSLECVLDDAKRRIRRLRFV